MPFQSEKQRRYLHANHPEIAKRWERDYANGGISNHFRRRPLQEGGYQNVHQTGAVSQTPGNVQTKTGNGGGNGGGDGPIHPIHQGPTLAEIEAQKKAKAAADAKAEAELEAAKHKAWIDRKDKKKKKVDWVNENLENVDAGFKLKNFATSLNPLDLLKPNLPLVGASFLYNKLKKKKKDKIETSALDDSEYDFSEIEGQEAKLTGLALAQKRVLEKKKGMEEFGGETFTSEDQKFLDKLIEMDKEETVYSKPITAIGAKGGVARKNYYHGGILDINESEEIISDDGNDIELTAYNAEFDDPNDLSTGVKSLFQAKDGGGDFDVKKKYKKSNLVTAPKYWKSAPDHPGTELAYITKPEKDLLLKADLHNSLNGKLNKGPAGIISLNGWESDFSSDWGGEAAPQGAGPGTDPGPGKSVWKDVDTGDASIAEDIAAKERKRQQDLKDLIARGDEEKYDTEEQMISDKWTHDTVAGETKRGTYKIDRDTQLYKKALADQKAKLRKMGKGKLGGLGVMLLTMLVMGVPLGDALKALPKGISLSKEDLSAIVKNSIPVMQAKSKLKNTLEEVQAKYEELGMAKFHHSADTKLQAIDQQLLDLTRTKDEEERDDKGGEQLTIDLLEDEMADAQGVWAPKDYMAEIRARQAKRVAALPDWQLTDAERELKNNPIIDESVTDITLQANSGGLANLFRVKNQ